MELDKADRIKEKLLQIESDEERFFEWLNLDQAGATYVNLGIDQPRREYELITESRHVAEIWKGIDEARQNGHRKLMEWGINSLLGYDGPGPGPFSFSDTPTTAKKYALELAVELGDERRILDAAERVVKKGLHFEVYQASFHVHSDRYRHRRDICVRQPAVELMLDDDPFKTYYTAKKQEDESAVWLAGREMAKKDPFRTYAIGIEKNDHTLQVMAKRPMIKGDRVRAYLLGIENNDPDLLYEARNALVKEENPWKVYDLAIENNDTKLLKKVMPTLVKEDPFNAYDLAIEYKDPVLENMCIQPMIDKDPKSAYRIGLRDMNLDLVEQAMIGLNKKRKAAEERGRTYDRHPWTEDKEFTKWDALKQITKDIQEKKPGVPSYLYAESVVV